MNNKPRIQCPECAKSYADRRSLKRHLVGLHNMCFLPRTDLMRVMVGEELEEAKVLSRHRQCNGKMRRRERGEKEASLAHISVRGR